MDIGYTNKSEAKTMNNNQSNRLFLESAISHRVSLICSELRVQSQRADYLDELHKRLDSLLQQHEKIGGGI